MSISVPDNNTSLYSLKKAKSYLSNAITNLTNQISLYIDSENVEMKNNCTSILNDLVQEYNKVCTLINEIPLSQAYIKEVDKLNTPATDTDTITKGMIAGTAGSIIGHYASTDTISAFITKGYRGGARQIHGFAHEVIFAQNQSWRLSNIFKTAVVDGSNKPGSDVIVKGLKNTTYELKATQSPQYMKNAASNSKYAGSKVIGTSEIAAKTGCPSSGIDYARTVKVGAESQAKSSFSLALKSLGKSALSGGIAGAVIGGGIEAATKYSAWKNGEISGKEYAKAIGKEAAIGGASGAIAAVGTAGVVAAVGLAGVALPAVAVVGIGAAIGGIASWGLHKLFK